MPQSSIPKPYAGYDWYTEQYFGSALTEAEYSHYAKQASYLVDQVTHGNLERLKISSDTLPDFVKDATCAAAEILKKYQAAADGTIQSESNDGYSVSYKETETEQQVNSRAVLEIRRYLANTGLLFRGVYYPPKQEEQADD